jgi:hypothetical protein
MNSEKVETADVETVHAELDGPVKPGNGLAQHVEIKAERRFVRKIDFLILPLLTIMFFLASLVSLYSLQKID